MKQLLKYTLFTLLALAGLLLVMLFLGVPGCSHALAQELPDADFNNVTIQATTPLVLGDDTGRNICVSFDQDSVNDTFCHDEATESLMAFIGNTSGMFAIAAAQPEFAFFDTDISLTVPQAAFDSFSGVPDANDSTFSFYTLQNSTGGFRHALSTTTGTGNPIYRLANQLATTYADFGYTGVNGAQYAFIIGAQGYYLDDDLYIDENSPGGVIVKDTGGACFRCAAVATQSWTLTNTTVDRSFDANTQCQVTFTATTILAADQYLVQLRNAANWVRVSCNWNGGTTPSVTVDVEECDSAGASCSAAQTASLTCDGGGDSTTAFGGAAGSGADADDWINLNFGTPSGTPGVLSVTVTANEPNCELADVAGTIVADLDALNILGTSTDRALSCAALTCPSVTP